MEMTLLENIKDYTSIWKARLRDRLDGQAANLFIIQVGDNEASNRYVRNKVKDAEEIGIRAEVVKFPDDVTQETVEAALHQIVYGAEDIATGIIIQLPLPAHLDKDRLTNMIPYEMDVDGFKLGSPFKPCTPLGIVEYLKYCGCPFTGANALVIGRSDIVGKPMAQMLTDLDCTVTLAHSKTRNLWDHIENADFIVCAVGKPRFLNCYAIHVPVIDVGINFITDEEGVSRLVGDTFNTENRDVTPVPGGVGLLTRCALMENMIRAVEMKEKKNEA